MKELFKLPFQCEYKGRYYQLTIYPEAKVYTHTINAERDMTLKFFDLDHYDDMLRMETSLMNEGYMLKVI